MTSRNPDLSSGLAKRSAERIGYWLDAEAVSGTSPIEFVGCLHHHVSDSVVLFVNNWVAVFNALSESKNKTFSEKARAFNMAIRFFYSRRVIALTTILTLYICGLYFPMMQMDVKNWEIYAASIIFNLYLLSLYLWSVFIYTGSSAIRELDDKYRNVNSGLFALLQEFMIELWADQKSPDAVIDPRSYSIEMASAQDGYTISSNLAKSLTAADVNNILLHSDSVSALNAMERKVSLTGDALASVVSKVSTQSMQSAMQQDSSSPAVPASDHPLQLPRGKDRSLLERQFEASQLTWYSMLSTSTKYLTYVVSEKENSEASFQFRNRAIIFLRTSMCVNIIGNLLYLLGNIVALYTRFGGVNFGLHDHCQNYSAFCVSSQFAFTLTLGGSIACIQGCLLYSSVGLIYCGLLLSGDLGHELTQRWIRRFSGLRRIDPPDVLEVVSKEDKEETKGVEEDSKEIDESVEVVRTIWQLSPLFERDAYERFLFIKHYMKTASTTWTGFLCFAILGALLFTIVTYYELISCKERDYYKILIVVGALIVEGIIIGMPIYCLAFANDRVRQIREFGRTAPDDFALLGDKLQDWLTTADVFWTIAGLPITPAIVESYLYSFVGVVPAMILSISHFQKK